MKNGSLKFKLNTAVSVKDDRDKNIKLLDELIHTQIGPSSSNRFNKRSDRKLGDNKSVAMSDSNVLSYKNKKFQSQFNNDKSSVISEKVLSIKFKMLKGLNLSVK